MLSRTVVISISRVDDSTENQNQNRWYYVLDDEALRGAHRRLRHAELVVGEEMARRDGSQQCVAQIPADQLSNWDYEERLWSWLWAFFRLVTKLSLTGIDTLL